MKTVIALALALAAGTVKADAFGDAFDSAFNSALGEHDAAVAEATEKLSYQEPGSDSWVEASAGIEYMQKKWTHGLSDLYKQIERDLIAQGYTLPDPGDVIPGPEQAPERDRHFNLGYDDDGGIVTSEQYDTGYVMVIIDQYSREYSTFQAACEALGREGRHNWTDWSVASYRHVVGLYGEVNSVDESTDIGTFRNIVRTSGGQAECFSNSQFPGQRPNWRRAGFVYYRLPDPDNCPAYDIRDEYSQMIPADGRTTWHIQFDFGGNGPDGEADSQHAMTGDEHEGIGYVTEYLTYDEIITVMPSGFTGQINMRVFGVQLTDDNPPQEVVVSPAVFCMNFQDVTQNP